MNLRVISRNVGMALLVSALFMLLSIVVSLLDGGDSALAALSISFIITFIVGAFPFIFVRSNQAISLREGYVIIVLAWLLSFIFGMLPYALYGEPFTVANAWFESVSGFTTTGASILEDIEALPRSLLFWRSSTHFIGGLGVVVFLLLIIPDSSPVRLRLTHMEVSSLSRENYRFRSRKTVNIFASVYLFIVGAAFFSYWAAGMSPFDAVNHAMSVGATGGFSTRNLSIGAFHSVTIDIITIVFMVLGSIHFGLLYLSFATRSLRPLRNPVIKFYLLILVLFTLMCAGSLRVNGIADTWGKALLDSSFHVTSYASTTGFAISDNASWGMMPSMLLLIVSIICGCAGSTTGGVKVDRILVLNKAVRRQIFTTLNPRSVRDIRMGNSYLREEEVYPHVLFLLVYLLFLILSMVLALILMPENTMDAVYGSISCLGTVGPSVGDTIGSMGNYNSQPAALKVLFTLDMFLGRVEIYPVLAVIAMMTHVKTKKS